MILERSRSGEKPQPVLSIPASELKMLFRVMCFAVGQLLCLLNLTGRLLFKSCLNGVLQFPVCSVPGTDSMVPVVIDHPASFWLRCCLKAPLADLKVYVLFFSQAKKKKKKRLVRLFFERSKFMTRLSSQLSGLSWACPLLSAWGRV